MQAAGGSAPVNQAAAPQQAEAPAAASPTDQAPQSAPAQAPAAQPAPEEPKKYHYKGTHRTLNEKPIIGILVEREPQRADQKAEQKSEDDPNETYKTANRGGAAIWRYANAVEEYGGQVRWITPGQNLDGVHAVLVPGGADINPSVYGQQANADAHLNVANESFDRFEIDMIKSAIDQKIPVRGVCRGMQLMNVAFGGTLMQDVPLEQTAAGLDPKYATEHGRGVHAVSIMPNSKLRAMLRNDGLRVNSYHHQGIDAVAKGFQVVARAADNIIEAIEMPDKNAIGVQFHPEKAKSDSLVRERFFKNLVDDAMKYWDDKDPIWIESDTPPPPPPDAPKYSRFSGNEHERRRQHEAEQLGVGLENINKAGYQLVYGWDHKPVTPGMLKDLQEKDQSYALRRKPDPGKQWDNPPELYRFSGYKVKHVILSFAPEGAEHLYSTESEAINRMRTLEQRAGVRFCHNKLGARLFHRHVDNVEFEIQKAELLDEGKLLMVWKDPSGKEHMEKLKNLDGLRCWSIEAPQKKDGEQQPQQPNLVYHPPPKPKKDPWYSNNSYGGYNNNWRN